MRRPATSLTHRRLRPVRFIAALLVGVAALAACGSDDDESAQDRYCAAGDDLESSVTALTQIDLIAEGTNGLDDALGAVEDDVSTLADTASEAASDEVSALEESVQDLGSALEGLAGEITSDNVSVVATAVESLATSAQAVYQTLTDC